MRQATDVDPVIQQASKEVISMRACSIKVQVRILEVTGISTVPSANDRSRVCGNATPAMDVRSSALLNKQV